MKPLLNIPIFLGILSCSQPNVKQPSVNDEPRSEIVILDTGNISIYREYFDNDTISLEVGMKDNKMTGFRRSYYPSGRPNEIIQIKGSYPTDYCCPDGLYKVYHENGLIQEIHQKENGEFQGQVVSFDTLGHKKAEYQVKDGLKHGMTKEFNVNGTVKAIYEYNHDTLIGTAYLFMENGDSLKKYALHKGKLDFPIKYWKEDGRSLLGEYYDDQNFKVKWTWRDSANNIIKQEIVDTVNGQFITPEY